MRLGRGGGCGYVCQSVWLSNPQGKRRSVCILYPVQFECKPEVPCASLSRLLVTFLSSASTALSMQNNSVFGDLGSDEAELLYSAYGDETGVQCALR